MFGGPDKTPDEIDGCETLWRTVGNFLARKEQYARSLAYYDRAIRVTPHNKKALLDRSRSRARCNNIEGALDDIEHAISLDRRNLLALAEKAQATYLATEFEEALIQNQRLVPLRRKPDCFYLGILKCHSTMEQCLGDVAGKPMRDHYLIIRKLAWKWNIDVERIVEFVPKNRPPCYGKRKSSKKDKKIIVPEPEDESLRVRDSLFSHASATYNIPHLETAVKFAPLQRYTKNIDAYMSEKYLERMYRERGFLKNIKKHPGLKSPNANGEKNLRDIAKDCYTKITQKQEILRTMRPFYFIKYQEAKISGKLHSRQLAELMLHQQNYRKEATKILVKMEKFYQEKNLNGIIEMSEKLISYCEGKPKRLLPEKDEFIAEIHSYIRKGFYELYRLNPEQVKWDQDKRIMVCLFQPISREPSTDSVIGQFDLGLVDLKQQLEIFETRLEQAETPEALCYCYHELARFCLYAKHFEDARVYARRCLMEAEKEEELEEWCLNATMIMLRICVRQQNKADALIETQNAMDIATKRNDHGLKTYLNRVKYVLGEIEFGDVPRSVITAKRQQKILALMSNTKMKEEFSHLFRTMAALPQSRRLSIVAGKKKEEPEQSQLQLVRSKTSKKRLSILSDNSRLETEKMPSGAEFMQLVQFHV